MLNKVMVIGHLGKDPEVRYTGNGTAVASFSVAATERWKKDGEQQEHTEWFNIVAWQRLAEICGEYLKKGSLIYAEGKLRTRKYEDKDGNTKYITEIVIDTMKMLGPKPESERDTRTHSERKAESRPASRPRSQTGTGFDDMDDDIPF